MTKLTPARRLKQLEKSGWLGFVEHMESHGVSPRQVARLEPDGMIAVGEYCVVHSAHWLSEDIERDMFANIPSTANFGKMVSLSEQLANPREGSYPKRKKNNKLIQKFKKTGEPL